jgi:hypothetical protein
VTDFCPPTDSSLESLTHEIPRYIPVWQARHKYISHRPHCTDAAIVLRSVGEIDAIISAIPLCSLVSSPIFGPPAMADKATLIIALSGDYRSKKEVAYTLVPAIGRRVLDLGGNVEKGDSLSYKHIFPLY